MGFADRLPIEGAHSECFAFIGFRRPRSDLFCHHDSIRLSNRGYVLSVRTVLRGNGRANSLCHHRHRHMPRVVVRIPRQQRPDDPCALVRHNHHRNVRGTPIEQSLHPSVCGRFAPLRRPGPPCGAQRLAAAGLLPRYQAEPCGQMPTVVEVLRIPHRGHQRAGGDRSNARNSLEFRLRSFCRCKPIISASISLACRSSFFRCSSNRASNARSRSVSSLLASSRISGTRRATWWMPCGTVRASPVVGSFPLTSRVAALAVEGVQILGLDRR